MKIYQIHNIGGEYEDAYDVIVGTYLRRESAEKALKFFQDELDERINTCSYMWDDNESFLIREEVVLDAEE